MNELYLKVATFWTLTGLCVPIALAQGRGSLRITEPADGTVVKPGQTIRAKVEASPGTAFKMISIIGETPIGFSPPRAAPPWEFSIQLPVGIRLGKYTLTALGAVVPGQPTTSTPVMIDVETAEDPVNIRTEPLGMTFNKPGDTVEFVVHGSFADGSSADITESTATRYVSDAPGIVSVGATGMLTAVSPGSAKVTVSYRGKRAIIVVTVLKPKQ